MANKILRFEPGGRHAERRQDKPREMPMPEPVRDDPDIVEHPALQPQKKSGPRVSKAVYKILLVLLAAALTLIIMENYESLTAGNIGNWIRTKAVGLGFGDGYPVDLIGSVAEPGNFGADEDSVYVVSDTALTVLNGSAKEIFSVRHSYNNPAVSAAGDRYLLYNAGGTGYQINTAAGTELDETADCDITAAAIAASGKFALALQPADFAAELRVFLKNGTEQYSYKFADTYISAVALNADGTRGAVASITSRKGALVSHITVLDFSKTEPIAQYESEGNMIFDLLWSAANRVIAIGDTQTVVSNARFEFEAYDYGGREVTAMCKTNKYAAVSVSNYAYGGNSTLLVFENDAVPTETELPGRAEWLSCVGETAAALLPNMVVTVDVGFGKLEAGCDITADTKGIALGSESAVYLMGVREIRKENLKVLRNTEELFQIN